MAHLATIEVDAKTAAALDERASALGLTVQEFLAEITHTPLPQKAGDATTVLELEQCWAKAKLE